MMSDYSSLDLDVVKQAIAQLCYIDEAREYILNEEVSFNPLQIRKNGKETKEALELIKAGNSVSFDGINNINELLAKADKNIILDGIELKNILVFHNHCQRIQKQFLHFPEDLSIRDYTDSLYLNSKVFAEIDRCIDNAGEIKDDASDRLRSLNSELVQCEKDLYNKAHTFIDKHGDSLQEPSVYLRNERITFLIKNADKNKYQGYTYGTSSSGLASYVEPASFIEANNHKMLLIQQREDEIERILIHLSYLVASVAEDLSHNFESLMFLAVIFAKAEYGYRRGGIICDLQDDLCFSFTDLCHPLIAPEKVVANSYRLYEPYQGIVICGSNTGGKTVSLKAIGLAILMTYLGIPVIASEGHVPFYRNIFVDIDDNQSIQDSLSTFSAHISNINSILNQADERCLILIDELISGTDPKEAQAISLAIMDRIRQIGSRFIITTHFDDIKNYSYKDEKILLSSVGFNMETLSPTYRYLEDSVGSSNAIEIASRYFDDQQLIEKARIYLEKARSNEEEMLEKLSHQIEENEVEKERLQQLETDYKNRVREYENRLKEFEQDKEKLRNSYIRELNSYIEEVKEKAEEKFAAINATVQEKQVMAELDELEIDKTLAEEKAPISVGDNVRIGDNEQIGTVTALNGNNAIINMRGMTIRAKVDDLILMPRIQKPKTKVISKTYKRVPAEINVVGERVEDGVIMVEEYLDRANASHMSQVKVIHGIGTGALRSAIRDRLKKLSYVANFKDGDYYDGGSAVTIVEFKQ